MSTFQAEPIIPAYRTLTDDPCPREILPASSLPRLPSPSIPFPDDGMVFPFPTTSVVLLFPVFKPLQNPLFNSSSFWQYERGDGKEKRGGPSLQEEKADSYNARRDCAGALGNAVRQGLGDVCSHLHWSATMRHVISFFPPKTYKKGARYGSIKP